VIERGAFATQIDNVPLFMTFIYIESRRVENR
jgi:hypothetical protein